jgi:hypothetical protein
MSLDARAVLIPAILSFIVGFGVWQYQENKYEAIIQAHRAEANQKLQDETMRLLEKERLIQSRIFDLENKYHESQQELSTLDAKYRQLVRDAGGLRDKGSGNCGDRSNAKSPSASGNNDSSSRVLSEEATDFLLRLTAEADYLREQVLLCQEWAKLMIAQ